MKHYLVAYGLNCFKFMKSQQGFTNFAEILSKRIGEFAD